MEQSNVRAERSNGKIQGVKTIGRGYGRFNNFGSAISFLYGGLGLYTQKYMVKPELEDVLKPNNLIRSTAELVEPEPACTPK